MDTTEKAGKLNEKGTDNLKTTEQENESSGWDAWKVEKEKRNEWIKNFWNARSKNGWNTSYLLLEQLWNKILNQYCHPNCLKLPFDGILSGFGSFDTFCGGFRNGTLTVISAEKKTVSLGRKLLGHLLLDNRIPLAVCTLSASSCMILLQLIADHSNVSIYKIRSGLLTMDNFRKLSDSFTYLENLPLNFIDLWNQSPEKLRKVCYDAHRTDHVKIIIIEDMGKKPYITEAAPLLKQTAVNLHIPIIVFTGRSGITKKTSADMLLYPDGMPSASFSAPEEDADPWHPDSKGEELSFFLTAKKQRQTPVPLLFSYNQ
jgi:hypothetical protein